MNKSPEPIALSEIINAIGSSLRRRWETSRDSGDGDRQPGGGTRVAYRHLVDFLEANGLAGTELDPRNKSEPIAIISVASAGPLPQYLRF